MKIALAQMDVKPNQPQKNLDTMLEMIAKAKQENVDLIAFPEMCLSGYLVGDKFTDETYCQDLMSYNNILREASKDIAIIYGNIHVDSDLLMRSFTEIKNNHPNKDGRLRKYNAVYAYQNQKPVERINSEIKSTNNGMTIDSILPQGVQPKTLLPNYRFFDDERYFFSTKDIALDFNTTVKDLLQPFRFMDREGKYVNIGLEVCEDLWCEDYKLNGNSLNVTKMLIENGADAIINVSASPWTYGKNHARDKRINFIKNDLKNTGKTSKPFYYVNCIGVQNNGKNFITFDGGSTIYNSDAKPVKIAENSYEQDLIIVENETIDSMPVLERVSKSKIAEKYDAIVTGIKGIKEMFGFNNNPKFVIGLSGGIDSAVVAALLCQAVGNNNVIGINMPTIYNSDKTKNAALKIASELGIVYKEMPIQKVVDSVIDTIESVDIDGTGKKLSDLNLENIQAKIRGTDMLSNIASKYGAIFTNNGNKLEVALGYATLYGDVGGAIAPIADLTKEEVFDIARYINNDIYSKEIIPETLLPDKLFRFRKDQIQPSAELKNNQVDPMKFGYHDKILEKALDYHKVNINKVMMWYLDGELEKNLGITKELIERWNIDDPYEFVKDIEWFYHSIQKNVFKRIQSPPIIITSKTAFGYDLRESILPYTALRIQDNLRNKILSMNSYYNK
ncbi:MAG: NAD(+) synthase [Candidatus Woesearchaeota archaeon]